jgi:hypothetical protein
LETISESAIIARPMQAMSTRPSAISVSAMTGSLIRPTLATGIATCCFTAVANSAKHPCFSYIGGTVRRGAPMTPAVTEI